MFMYVNVDLKPSRQYAETWVFGMFSCCVRQGKYILGLGNWPVVGVYMYIVYCDMYRIGSNSDPYGTHDIVQFMKPVFSGKL